MKFPQVRSLRAVVLALGLVATFSTHAFAQRVSLLVAEEPSSQADLVNDVKSKLLATGRVASVDVFDVRVATPTPEYLRQFDSVMVWSSEPFQNRALLGNVLADYVDEGHGVVQTIFSFYSLAPGGTLGGRWEAEGYAIFNPGDIPLGNLVLGTHDSTHPIFDGVNSLESTVFGFYQAQVVPLPCAQVVGSWTNLEPLAAWCPGQHGGRLVALNLYPPSSDVLGFNWLASSDGAILMANALTFAAAAPVASNQAPTANAGADQTLEATGPAGAAFTVNGVVADPDAGDTLTIAWTGTGTVGTAASFSDTLPAPVGVTSAAYTLTLTVSDGNGGVASDTVVITVRDTTGPVLANVPGSPLTVTATSDAGANVPYGPVTASDLVDGGRPVTCSKSGLFPIGDTVVTCSSTDTRGNRSSASFTVRVTDVTTPGAMAGLGVVRSGNVNYEFEFGVLERYRERATFALKVTGNGRNDRFSAKTTDFVAFSDDPTVRPGRSHRPQVDTVLFSGTGSWNGHSGYRYEVSAVDQGDYYHRNDSVRFCVKAPNGAVVANVNGQLSWGFVESARLRR